VVDETAFTVSGRDITWRDVIAHARAAGAWDSLEREVSEGVALLHAQGPGPAPDQVRDAATAFRYARNLVAAEELEAWLEHWGLTVDDWMDHVRRSVLRDALASEPGSASPGHAVKDEEVAARVWPSAVCSGTLGRAALELAGLLAICDSLAETGVAVEPSRARAELRRRIVTGEALKTQIQSRALDWVRIDSQVLTFARADAAREALALLRQDGFTATEVAGIAHASLEHRIDYIEDVEEDLKAALIGSKKGDIFGPLEKGDGWLVVVVNDKVGASLDDTEVLNRAEASIVERAIQRETDERVVWHGDP
jgi:hypothetical protein